MVIHGSMLVFHGYRPVFMAIHGYRPVFHGSRLVFHDSRSVIFFYKSCLIISLNLQNKKRILIFGIVMVPIIGMTIMMKMMGKMTIMFE